MQRGSAAWVGIQPGFDAARNGRFRKNDDQRSHYGSLRTALRGARVAKKIGFRTSQFMTKEFQAVKPCGVVLLVMNKFNGQGAHPSTFSLLGTISMYQTVERVNRVALTGFS